MKVAISIVNYKTPQLVVDCLDSVLQEMQRLDGIEVFLVDNLSQDDSVETFRQYIEQNHCHNKIHLIEADRNGGFSYGNNLAIKSAMSHKSQPDFIYLLNPDTILHKEGIVNLVHFMEANPKVGIAGGSLVGPDGEEQGAPRRFPSILSELETSARLGAISKALDKHVVPLPLSEKPFECDWVSGASMMIRRQVVESIGCMDEGYFLYFEEVDYCFQAKSAGFQIWYVPDSVITHIEGAATGVNQRKRRGKYWYDSRRRYFVVNYGIFHLLGADLLWAIGRLSFNLRRVLRLGKSFDSAESDPTWFAWDLLVGDLKAVLSGKVFGERKRANG
ncbi:glycosyltransferase family 2 protein [Aliikangiella marina]|uniref:Glycosyltransferase family 2 protein n=1 Tax=Aliikangiella marina TaxID=1712262 RepID=A0A545TBK4_9GAMM|nr:glycosyltransferase family 2 protein [Aliikangiella marina]TQV74595.1 glycosyltransferase family 2 protein [Aliikangiella marina]